MKYKEIQPDTKAVYYGKHWNTTVLIIGILEGSRTKVNVKDIDRGHGWDENTQSYKGYYVNNGNCATDTWSRGENHGYGQKFTAHIKELEHIQ